MVAKDANSKSKPVPGLPIKEKQGIRRFARSKARKDNAFDRSIAFEESKFKIEEHLKLLGKENVKISLK